MFNFSVCSSANQCALLQLTCVNILPWSVVWCVEKLKHELQGLQRSLHSATRVKRETRILGGQCL